MNDTDIEICYLSASDTLKKYKEKKLSPVEVLSAVIKRIETVNPKINACLLYTSDAADDP